MKLCSTNGALSASVYTGHAVRNACWKQELNGDGDGDGNTSSFWGPGTLFIAQAARLQRHLHSDHQPVLVAVSRTLDAPTVVAPSPSAALHKQLAAIRASVDKGILRGGCAIIKGAAGGPDCVSLSAAVGILLGYPVVYCVLTTERDNCLSNRDLVLTEAFATCTRSPASTGSSNGSSSSTATAGSDTDGMRVLLTSFSVPAALLDADAGGSGAVLCRAAVLAWEADMQHRWETQQFYQALPLMTRTISLPMVAL